MITTEQAERLMIFQGASRQVHNSLKSLLSSMEQADKQIAQFMESIDTIANDNFLSNDIHTMFGLMRLSLSSAKSHVEIASQLMESAVIDMGNVSALVEDFLSDSKVSNNVPNNVR